MAYHGSIMTRLRIVPRDDSVAFPGMPVTLSVDLGGDSQVLLVPRRENTYASVGVVAEASEGVKGGGRRVAVALTPLHRGVPGRAVVDPDGVLRVDVEPRPDQPAP